MRGLLVAAAILLTSCSKTQNQGSVVLSDGSIVVSDDAPVYSGASAMGAITTVLHKGQAVAAQPAVSGAAGCWLKVVAGPKPPRSGFIRCEDVDRPGSMDVPEPAADPSRTDGIDRLLTLAGVDQYVKRMSDQSSLRFLSNTRRIDEDSASVREVYERAFHSAGFDSQIRARLLPYSADPRITWLSEQFSRPLVRKATDLLLRANSTDARHQLMPYLTQVETIPASSSRVQLVERMERALDEPEAYVDPMVAFARGAAKAQSENGPNPRHPDPAQLEQTLSRVRTQAIKEATSMRVVHLYALAPLSDAELEEYVRLVESDNVKWMYRILRDGILRSSETVGSEVAAGLAHLSKAAIPALGNNAVCQTPQECYEQGVRLIDSGKPGEATGFLDSAIHLKPDFAIAYYKRGNAYRDADNASKAVDDYTQAIRIDRSMTLAYLNRGIAFRYLGQAQRALEDFTHGIQSNSQVAAVWIERAITYNDLQQYVQAVADYTQAVRITPADGEAWAWRGMSHGQLSEWRRSWEDCEVGIRLGVRPSELGGAYSCTGRALAQMNDYAGAISELSRSIELNPASPGPDGSAVTYQNRGWAYEQAGRIEDALRDYEKGIELDGQDAWTHCQRAGVLDKLGRSAEANRERAYCQK